MANYPIDSWVYPAIQNALISVGELGEHNAEHAAMGAGLLGAPAASLNRYTLGICGDSISAHGFNGPSLQAEGWAGAAPAMAGIVCKPVMYATAGLTAAQWETTWLPTVLVDKPSAVTLMIGTNDLTPANYQGPITRICDALRVAGIYVIHLSIPPNSTSSTTANGVVNLNEFVRKYWKGKYGGEFVDVYSIVTDSISANSPWKTNYCQDTVSPFLHPSNLGGYYISLALYPVLQRLFPKHELVKSQNDYVGTNATSNQLLANPLMLGTAGSAGTNCTGSFATSWNAAGHANVAIVGSLAAADSGIGQKQILTCTATGAGQCLFLSEYIHTLYVDADIIAPACRLKISSATALSRCYFYIYASGGDAHRWQDSGQFTSLPANQQEYLAAKPIPALLPRLGNVQCGLLFNFTGAGGAVIEISQAEVRKNP